MNNLETFQEYGFNVQINEIWNPFVKKNKYLKLTNIRLPKQEGSDEFIEIDPFGEEDWEGDDADYQLFDLQSIKGRLFYSYDHVFYKVDRNIFIPMFDLFVEGHIMLNLYFTNCFTLGNTIIPDSKREIPILTNDKNIIQLEDIWLQCLNKLLNENLIVKELFYLNFIKNEPAYEIVKKRRVK